MVCRRIVEWTEVMESYDLHFTLAMRNSSPPQGADMSRMAGLDGFISRHIHHKVKEHISIPEILQIRASPKSYFSHLKSALALEGFCERPAQHFVICRQTKKSHRQQKKKFFAPSAK